ncbi:deaminase domain-containing protein [Pseudomonas sp. A-B-26]|uniref:deaminase domain-containing protein n=1 Tax=Pseudomonas sp. A-B-26 TaxID=2832406 RepID=UPI001CBBAB8B|nr:deaminase domain-containing protein [Pseudomonas sp. A-B-26]
MNMPSPTTSPSDLSEEQHLPFSAAMEYQGVLSDYDTLIAALRKPDFSSKDLETFIVLQSTSLLRAQDKEPGTLKLVQMINHYGISPWDPGNAAEHRATIHTLEEKRARYSLQLDSGVDIEAINRTPDKKDLKLLATIQKASPKDGMTLDSLIAQLTDRDIIDIVKRFLPESQTSLFSHFEKNTSPRPTIEQVRATPMVFLEKILRSAESQRLGSLLLEGLNWYGGKPGEDASAGVRIKLISKAIRLWTNTSRNDKPENISGYPWQQRSNWGKSYQNIWAEFEQHLFDSKRASSMVEAILLARLFQTEFPTEFQVCDIPPDLPYRSSVVWVNFVHGVTLAEAMEPDLIQRMSFQQLVDFPLRQSMQASPQELELITLCRMPATLEWAITNGVVTERTDSDYSLEEKTQSIKSLDEHTDALRKAIIQLDVDYPKRSSIAEREMRTYFRDSLRWTPVGFREVFGNRTHFPFISDGRKLIEDFESSEAGGFLRTPPLRDKIYTFQDVYMSGRLNRSWHITQQDGTRKSAYRISLNTDRTINSNDPSFPAALKRKPLPDATQLFEAEFKSYLDLSKSAYQTLLKSLLTSLPHDERQAIELGEVKIYTLRKSTNEIELEDETPDITLPLRLRMGFILQISYKNRVAYYECLPRAGIIRRRVDFSFAMLNGTVNSQQIQGVLGNAEVIAVRREQRVPIDWSAHETGSFPKENARCEAIIDQFGKTFTAPSIGIENEQSARPSVTSSRATELSNYIADHFFYYDEKLLHASAKGETEIERIAARPHWLVSVKGFIPFWGGIEDLLSGDPKKRVWAIFGLIVDAASFALPLGKFVSGSVKLASIAVRSGVRAALPRFGALAEKLLISSVQNAIPFYGLPTLALRLSRGTLRGLYAGVKFAAKKSYNSLKPALGRANTYNFIEGLPQVNDPGRWRPLTQSDQLATFRGLDDVPVRNIGSTTKPAHYLIDPLSAKPYGPVLKVSEKELSIGPSMYPTVRENSEALLFNIPENTRVNEVLEIDGRTTLFIDDVPYRLDGDALRRADLRDARETLKPIPCRPRRAPGSVCETSYAWRDPAPTPAAGTFDETKGWAPWFGDSIYTSAITGRVPLLKTVNYPGRLMATIEYQKGIYGRIKANISGRGSQFDTFKTGAIIVPALDGSKHYIFTRLGAGDFYVAERFAGQSLTAPLTLRKAKTSPHDVVEELKKVYIGSLNANNMARIYGINRVERALKAMDDIAIPIGGHTNPPQTLKHLNVDTSPAEAVLFDHSTRMIVRHSTDGAATWSLSRTAPDSARETTAEIFNTLFCKTVVTVESSVRGAPKALKIDNTMRQLQIEISKKLNRPIHSSRNIAFAEIKTKAGVREVYVSVSGNQGDTHFLPLFSRSRQTNEVKVDGTSYFNIDHDINFPQTSLSVSDSGKLRAIPHTIDNIETYTPALTSRPTSLDTESKLISAIRDKYPDPKELDSITIATTMAPCDSCAIVMKQFSYDGNPDALGVIWK